MATTTTAVATATTRQPATAPRLESLDVFRGLTIAGMTLVNNPGTWRAIYAPLKHAEWDGWTPTDLIFPFFLFIVGVSMMLSFAKRRQQADRGKLLGHVLYRAIVIFLLGLFLAFFMKWNLHNIRIPGVLQRIAVCYLIASIIVLYTGRRGRILALIALLAGYWALMRFVPVPGFGIGRLDVDGNLAAYVDRTVFGHHMWKATWDPEGIVSTLPAVASVLFGTFCAEWLRSAATTRSKVTGLLAAGAAGLAVGRVLHMWLPINKNLWTSSYSIFTAGFAAVLLAFCYWTIDVKGWRAWGKPFVVFGTNAILTFVASNLLTKYLVYTRFEVNGQRTNLYSYIFDKVFAPHLSVINASLAFSISYVLLWLAIMYVFYRNKIFLKV